MKTTIRTVLSVLTFTRTDKKKWGGGWKKIYENRFIRTVLSVLTFS